MRKPRKMDYFLPGEDNSLKWSFQCLVCIRAWRERALKRQGLPRDEVLANLTRNIHLSGPDSKTKLNHIETKKIDLKELIFWDLTSLIL